MYPLNSLALAAVVTPLARARLPRGRSYSNFDEERILREYVAMLLPKDHGHTAVDLGAGDGVRHSNTHALFTSGWRGLAVDGDANRSYRLASLEYNNAFIAPLDLPRVQAQDAVTVYREGYLVRPDRRKKFPLNQDMEVLLSMTPPAAVKFLNDFYSKHAGKYQLNAGEY